MSTDRFPRRAPLRSRTGRVAALTAGWTCLGLAFVGVWLPLLPTTPLVLLAAWLFARSSERFHAMLLESRIFGPTLVEWQRHRAVPRRAKVAGILVLVASFGVSVTWLALGLERPILAAIVGLGGCALVVFLASLPSRSPGSSTPVVTRESREESQNSAST